MIDSSMQLKSRPGITKNPSSKGYGVFNGFLSQIKVCVHVDWGPVLTDVMCCSFKCINDFRMVMGSSTTTATLRVSPQEIGEERDSS